MTEEKRFGVTVDGSGIRFLDFKDEKTADEMAASLAKAYPGRKVCKWVMMEEIEVSTIVKKSLSAID